MLTLARFNAYLILIYYCFPQMYLKCFSLKDLLAMNIRLHIFPLIITNLHINNKGESQENVTSLDFISESQ